MNPELSVIMPVYNCGPYLEAALNSIQQQTFKFFELIVIDDGSTDDSLKIIQSFAQKDPRIVYRSRPNTGICGALNEALSLARGQVIARMDGDDICDPSRLGKQFVYMRQNPSIVAAGTGLLYVDPEARPLYEMKPAAGHDQIMAEFLTGHSMAVTHATAIFRAGPYKEAGYRDEYNTIEDLDIFLRLAEHGQFGNLREPLYHYRQHPNGTNVKRFAQQQQLKKQLLTEYCVERQLIPPEIEVVEGKEIAMIDLYEDWACRAFLGGFNKTGLHYANKFLKEGGVSMKKLMRYGQILKLAKR